MDSKLHAIIMQIHEECLVKICDQNIALDERVIKFATNRLLCFSVFIHLRE